MKANVPTCLLMLAACLSCTHSRDFSTDHTPLRVPAAAKEPRGSVLDALPADVHEAERAYVLAVEKYVNSLDRAASARKAFERLVAREENTVSQAQQDYRRALKVTSHAEARRYIQKAKRYQNLAKKAERRARAVETTAQAADRAAVEVAEASEALAVYRRKRADRAVPQVQDPSFVGNAQGQALHGTDVVAYYRLGAWRSGDLSHSTEWKGLEWLFSSAENLEFFKQDPAQFAPGYGGHCAWNLAQGRRVPADPTIWSVFDNRLYLHASSSLQDVWKVEVEANLSAADAFWDSFQGSR